MAKAGETTTRLSSEQKRTIEETQAQIPQVRKEIAALKRMGLDTSALEEKVNWAEDVGKTLLETFAD